MFRFEPPTLSKEAIILTTTPKTTITKSILLSFFLRIMMIEFIRRQTFYFFRDVRLGKIKQD
jgi:hypothetical protein